MFCTPLHAAARRLDHLVIGAGAPVDEAVTEDNRAVVDELRGLKAAQFTEAAVWRKQ